MRNLLICCSLLFAAASCIGGGNSPGHDEERTVKVMIDTFGAGWNQRTATLTVYSNTNWQLKSSKPWARPRPEQGYQTQTITFDLDENSSPSPRYTDITITSKDPDLKKFKKIVVLKQKERTDL